jgi:hypothetical protein
MTVKKYDRCLFGGHRVNRNARGISALMCAASCSWYYITVQTVDTTLVCTVVHITATVWWFAASQRPKTKKQLMEMPMTHIFTLEHHQVHYATIALFSRNQEILNQNHSDWSTTLQQLKIKL